MSRSDPGATLRGGRADGLTTAGSAGARVFAGVVRFATGLHGQALPREGRSAFKEPIGCLACKRAHARGVQAARNRWPSLPGMMFTRWVEWAMVPDVPWDATTISSPFRRRKGICPLGCRGVKGLRTPTACLEHEADGRHGPGVGINHRTRGRSERMFGTLQKRLPQELRGQPLPQGYPYRPVHPRGKWTSASRPPTRVTPNLAQPSSVILLRARTPIWPQFSDFRTAAISVSARSHFSNDQFVLPRDCAAN